LKCIQNFANVAIWEIKMVDFLIVFYNCLLNLCAAQNVSDKFHEISNLFKFQGFRQFKRIGIGDHAI
jgi:hypothetical protein